MNSFVVDNIDAFNAKEVVLEEPYESAKKQQTTKDVNSQEFISENISSIYNKANTVKKNFEIGKLFGSIKQFVRSIKQFGLKIKWFVYNS
ncbi:MAG: hypothetical protein LBJ79_03100 [Endomicrobium sp.]|jgi:hypothetical protein|nr:hypothetical protein [Endomicrobium sp.]